jgi:hypothetical protein
MSILFYAGDGVVPLTFDDYFTGDNGDPPNSERWELWSQSPNDGTYQIYNNKLRMSLTSGATQKYVLLKNIAETFPGDFDVQAGFSINTGPDTDYWDGVLTAKIIDGANDGWNYRISRLWSGSNKIRYSHYTPTSNINELANSSSTGKFRMTRSGNHFRAYHDIGAGWVSTYNNYTDSAGTVEIHLWLSTGVNNPAAIFDWLDIISV